MARNFNGSSDHIGCGTRQMPQSAFSCSAWIRPTSDVTALAVSVFDSSIGAAYMQLAHLSGGSVLWRILLDVNNYIGRTSDAAAVSQNAWTHLSFSWNGGTTSAAIDGYINGSVADTGDSNAGTFTGPSTAATIPLDIGVQNIGAGGSEWWPGDIAEVAMWNVALNAAEMSALARGYSPLLVRTSSLFAHYPLLRENIAYKQAAPTITGTTVVSHVPIIMPRHGRGR